MPANSRTSRTVAEPLPAGWVVEGVSKQALQSRVSAPNAVRGASPFAAGAPKTSTLANVALAGGGETRQYQVPKELLQLSRNKKKERALSVAVTPVAPKPVVESVPPSMELSGLPHPSPAAFEEVPPRFSIVPASQSAAPQVSPASVVLSERVQQRVPANLGPWLLVASLYLCTCYYAQIALRVLFGISG